MSKYAQRVLLGVDGSDAHALLERFGMTAHVDIRVSHARRLEKVTLDPRTYTDNARLWFQALKGRPKPLPQRELTMERWLAQPAVQDFVAYGGHSSPCPVLRYGTNSAEYLEATKLAWHIPRFYLDELGGLCCETKDRPPADQLPYLRTVYARTKGRRLSKVLLPAHLTGTNTWPCTSYTICVQPPLLLD